VTDGHLDTDIPWARPFEPERKVLGCVAAQPLGVSMHASALTFAEMGSILNAPARLIDAPRSTTGSTDVRAGRTGKPSRQVPAEAGTVTM
jgi:hypothetical protein